MTLEKKRRLIEYFSSGLGDLDDSTREALSGDDAIDSVTRQETLDVIESGLNDITYTEYAVVLHTLSMGKSATAEQRLEAIGIALKLWGCSKTDTFYALRGEFIVETSTGAKVAKLKQSTRWKERGSFICEELNSNPDGAVATLTRWVNHFDSDDTDQV